MRAFSLWRTWMVSSMLVDQMKSLASHVLWHYWNLSYVSLCTLNNWKPFNSLVPVYWGLYGYPEQRGMDGTPRSPVQRLVEAKEKVRYLWPDYFFPPQTSRGYLGTWNGLLECNCPSVMGDSADRKVTLPIKSPFCIKCLQIKLECWLPCVLNTRWHDDHSVTMRSSENICKRHGSLTSVTTTAVPDDKHNHLSCFTVSQVLLLLISNSWNLKGVENGIKVKHMRGRHKWVTVLLGMGTMGTFWNGIHVSNLPLSNSLQIWLLAPCTRKNFAEVRETR